MQFTFPQFIEREPKIVGPLTFKQFIFIGIAGGVCMFLYFIVPLTVFVILAIFLLGWAFALAFFKIERTTFPVFIKNLIIFLTRPKIYLWEKKSMPKKIFREEETALEEFKEKPTLRIAGKSRLKQLFTRLETKLK